ncbi:hypothetical protein BD310DRAFT_812862 [Dichomitus squalens]|uniref:Uncharacterized protein n=1 Tax=Dichomitus squalens TaxID=114155 RepID=A0A4Q9Q3R6_9APHY|nr:hypothetical protein BD310DRAFT_812862 [Dichomitus squalens]
MLTCETPDDKSTWDFAIFSDQALWRTHGQLVADATRCLPGSFDRPPRDPSKKISSGYKAWEFLLYVYGLLPGLLRHVLPAKYYQHFCRLVFGVRIVLQYRFRPTIDLPAAHRSFVLYIEEYERVYYQYRQERLHFVRPSLHSLAHIVPEATRIGPGALHSQWTLENFIGNITREIKQHVTPYANVSEQALRRCQVNALKAMILSLAEPDQAFPQYSETLGDGYVLLPARDSVQRILPPVEARALRDFLGKEGVSLRDPNWAAPVRRWARLRLPNGQVARCAWKEAALEARGRKPRRARMVKLRNDEFAEIQFFFRIKLHDHVKTLAMIAYFTPRDPEILTYSHGTLLACTHLGDSSRSVVYVKHIVSVIAMVPLPLNSVEARTAGAATQFRERFFVVEKPGLEVANIAGRVEDFAADADGLDSTV